MKRKKGLPEIGKKKEKGVEGTFKFQFLRDKLEEMTDEQIRKEVGTFMLDVSNNIYRAIMQKRKEWAEEDKQTKKFMGIVH